MLYRINRWLRKNHVIENGLAQTTKYKRCRFMVIFNQARMATIQYYSLPDLCYLTQGRRQGRPFVLSDL